MKLLHVGCGQKDKSRIKGFAGDVWKEIRVDIDPSVNPDIIGDLTNLGAIGDGEVDAVFSSHNLEHLYFHQVPKALAEFRRVLNKDGIAIITCPDLQSVCEQVVAGKLVEPLYESPAGPIAAIDILYGHRRSLNAGNEFMAHRCGFTQATLTKLLVQSGFQTIIGRRRPKFFDLWAVAAKAELSDEDAKALAARYLP